MPPPPDFDPESLRSKRVPVQRKVSLKFKDLQGFVTELSENISMGGMFVRTDRPQKPGTLFDFELNLRQDEPLIQGIGEVIWVRQEGDGEDRPAGMGVRFLELAPGGRALIYKMVDEHISKGGTPFDLDASSPREGPSAAAPPTAPDSGGHVRADTEGDVLTMGSSSFGSGALGGDTLERGAMDTLEVEPPRDTPPSEPPKTPDTAGATGTDWPTKVFQPSKATAPAQEIPEPPPRAVRASSYAHLASPQTQSDEDERPARRSTHRRRGGALRWLLAVVALAILAVGSWALWSWWTEGPGTPADGGAALARAEDDRPRRDYRPATRLPGAADEPAEDSAIESAIENAQDGESGSEESGTETAGDAGTSDASTEPKRNANAEAEPLDDPVVEPAPSALTTPAEALPRDASDGTQTTATTATAVTTESRGESPSPTPRSEPSPPPRTRLSEVRDITWRRTNGGLTVVLETDGPVPAGSFDSFRMDEGSPRIVVRVRGIQEPYRPSVTVGEPELDRIRTGLHRRPDGNQLHVVLDVPSANVTLANARAEGDRLLLVLRP